MKITKKDIISFIEGNSRYYLDKIIDLDPHIKEQVSYRGMLCKDDCLIEGSCKYCGCTSKKVIFSTSSCNLGERFPDLMNKEDWEEYKNKNNITIDEDKEV